MSMDTQRWGVEFAQEFKKRDHKEVIGPCVGETISLSPLKISILSGKIIIEKDRLYICNSAKNIIRRGSEVLIVPDQSNQLFFLVDVVEKGSEFSVS